MFSQNPKGSVLVFSLIILSFMLISALSVAAVSVKERKIASATEHSSRSFQVADTGIEIMLQKIYKGNPPTGYATLDALATSLSASCPTSGPNQGKISFPQNTGTVTISFYDSTGARFTGSDCSNPQWRSKLIKIKSEGTSGNTTRAVEVGVAPVP